MSEFDKLKDEAEQYAQQHPDQVKKGEQAAEEKLGIGQQEPGQDQPAQQSGGDGDQNTGQQQ